jgi:predicted RNA polymerase sigma factor
MACNRKVEVRRYAAKAAGHACGRRWCPAMASTSRIVHNRRIRKSSKEIRERCRIGATRADLLRRLGRSQKSRAAYDKAIELAGNTAETAYLTRRRDQLG